MRISRFLPEVFIAAAMLAAPALSTAGVFVSITIAPPALPVYVQPPCPREGHLWTPGYWAYGPVGYYWVPGVWVAPPRVGMLWTPPYWGFGSGIYAFHPGYWGPHVGFYGGINYGYGYGGFGFVGGAWQGNRFAYNTAVTRVNTTVIHNTYINKTVVVNNTVVNNNRTSFNGPGGINARPTSQESAVEREQHFQPTSNQLSHERTAGSDRNQFASVNHGTPGTLAAARPMSSARPLAAAPQAQARINSRPPNVAPNANAANHPAMQPQAGPANPQPNQQRGFVQQQRPPQTQAQRPPQTQARPQPPQRPEPQAHQQQHPQQHEGVRPQARPQQHEPPHER